MEYINPENPVYVSFAFNDPQYPHIADLIQPLCERLEQADILYKICYEEVKCGSLNDFELDLSAACCIIIVYSHKYFMSEHCMNEYANIINQTRDDTPRKIILINSDGIKLDDNTIRGLVKFWKAEDAHQPEFPKKITKQSILHNFYHDDKTEYCIQNVNLFFSKYARKHTTQDNVLSESSYTKIISDIKDFYQQWYSNGQTSHHFTVPIPDNLLSRDKEVDKLYNGIIENRFFNLVGVGGSGKTSLAYLLMLTHSSQFNEIAYVVVNEDIKNDIVNQLNATLHLKFSEDEKTIDDKYRKIITSLEENYQNGSNLLIIDVNETANKTANEQFAKQLTYNTLPTNKIYPNKWKLLMLSREKLGTFNNYNLNDNNDLAFLKKLFQIKAGNLYANFKDVDGLMKEINYNPLLAEHLGIYLSKLPKPKSLSEIKTILYGKIKNVEITGVNIENRNDADQRLIINFLKNLLVYEDFNKNEQELLRHFVLWPNDFIAFDVIDDLIDFDSDDDLENALSNLSERSILSKKYDNTQASYKLHGMLAASIREQIEIEKQDYSIYLKNIERVIEYGYYDFMPFVDCIGNSLCEYDITDNYHLLLNVGCKLHIIYYCNVAPLLYYKCISICEKRYKETNNLHVLESLAIACSNLGALQMSYLGDLQSAEINLKKAITICEPIANISKDSHFFNVLAQACSNLGVLQMTYLDDFSSAEINLNKAITICEQIAKESKDQQMLNSLGIACSNLGNLQITYLGDIHSAEINFKKAISIGEQIAKESKDHQILNALATVCINLGALQMSYLGDFQSAEINLKKAITIGEHIVKESKDQQTLNALTRAYSNLGHLQMTYLGDLQSAAINFKKAISIGEQRAQESKDQQILNALALACSNLGRLQMTYLGDLQSAEMNLKKAITISEQIAKESKNPQILYTLAMACSNLGALQMSYLGDLQSAAINFNKAIIIGEQITKESKDQQILNVLAMAFNNLGVLQKSYFGDLQSAAINFKKAMTISEQIAKESKDQQILNVLAMAYFNLAQTQTTHSQAYDLAKENYEKAIAIREQLPKDNPECQDGLAEIFNELAYLLHNNHFKDFKSAKESCHKAIEISQQLTEKNPAKYLINLLNYKHSLAEICFDNNEIETAKSILEEIKPQAEKCLAENPDDEYTKNVNEDIVELLAKIKQ